MKDCVKAQITWLGGGRKSIPSKGARYCPICRVDVNNETLTLSLDFICTDVNENNECETVLSFLVPEFSAKEILKSGMSICLYEGSKKVAEAIIL